MKKYGLLFVLFILMTGCSSEENKPVTPEKSSGELPIFNEQVKALEKAKEVEQMLQMNMDNKQQAIDKASQ